ncbi:MAG TPA: hypothetical protein VGM92_14720, partial [Candidatus Kapabacteria bacterium]
YIYKFLGFFCFCWLAFYIGKKQFPSGWRGWGQLYSIPIASALAIGFNYFLSFCGMISRWRAGSQTSYHRGYFLDDIFHFFLFSFIFGCLYLWMLHKHGEWGDRLGEDS